MHRYKGTAYGVKKALEAINADIQVLEWFNHDKQPNTVEIVVLAKEGLDSSIITDVRRIIDITKPLHVSYGVILKARGAQTLTLISAAIYQSRLNTLAAAKVDTSNTTTAVLASSMLFRNQLVMQGVMCV